MNLNQDLLFNRQNSLFKPDHWDRLVRNSLTLKMRYETVKENTLLDNTDTIINKELYSYSSETYKNLLAKVFAVQPRPQSWTHQWPVKSRPNPCIGSPSVKLDLPYIHNDFSSNLMDWSTSDYLTVACPEAVYLWHTLSSRTLGRIAAVHPCCVKWNNDGTHLFTACRVGTYQLIDLETQMELAYGQEVACHRICHFTCAEFHPRMHTLLFVGCSKGGISVYPIQDGINKIKKIIREKPDNVAITSLKFSCDGNYFAVVNMNRSLLVYNFNSLLLVYYIKTGAPSRALAWHPWRRSCLVEGDVSGSMFVFNVLASKRLLNPDYSYTSTYNSAIMCLTFNPQSAELVVSHRIFNDPIGQDLTERTSQFETQLNVLASFDSVVDRMLVHTGQVPFLSWSPDGTKLASFGSDETARIWNFFPQKFDKNVRMKKKEWESDHPSTALELGNHMGVTLR